MGLREKPFRLFFPLGLILAWAGVAHWLLHAVGLLPDYRPVFHAITQIQGFMMCFAAGFLFTMIPRRAKGDPPALWQLVAVGSLLASTSAAAWFSMLALSQLCWFGAVGVLATFMIRSFRSGESERKPPPSFVWIPVALSMGVAGSLMTAAVGVFGDDFFWVHQLGQMFVLQGLFLGLVMGVGGMVLPLLTQGQGPPDSPRHHRIMLAHLVAAALLVASFWIEIHYGPRAGYSLRAAVVLAVLLFSAEIWRLPQVPGIQRRLVWLAAWMLPAGYVMGAMFPSHKKAGLHLALIGGFALMAFSVGLHVALSHGPRNEENKTGVGDRWRIPLFGGLLLTAAALRAMVDLDQDRFFAWIAASATAFLIGSLVWAWIALPRLR